MDALALATHGKNSNGHWQRLLAARKAARPDEPTPTSPTPAASPVGRPDPAKLAAAQRWFEFETLMSERGHVWALLEWHGEQHAAELRSARAESAQLRAEGERLREQLGAKHPRFQEYWAALEAERARASELRGALTVRLVLAGRDAHEVASIYGITPTHVYRLRAQVLRPDGSKAPPKMACNYGHDWSDPKNVYVHYVTRRGKRCVRRNCAACQRLKDRERRERRREQYGQT